MRSAGALGTGTSIYLVYISDESSPLTNVTVMKEPNWDPGVKIFAISQPQIAPAFGRQFDQETIRIFETGNKSVGSAAYRLAVGRKELPQLLLRSSGAGDVPVSRWVNAWRYNRVTHISTVKVGDRFGNCGIGLGNTRLERNPTLLRIKVNLQIGD